MVDLINVRLCGKAAEDKFEKNRGMFPLERFKYDPSTGIVKVKDQDDALKLWKFLGFRFPKAMDIIAESPEYEAVTKCCEGLPQSDRDQIDFFEAEVGCRVSIHINSSRPDLQMKLWDAIYSVHNPDCNESRSSRIRIREGYKNKLSEKQQAIAFDLGKWSMMIITDDGTFVSDDLLRLIEEEQLRRNRTKHRINRESSGRTQ